MSTRRALLAGPEAIRLFDALRDLSQEQKGLLLEAVRTASKARQDDAVDALIDALHITDRISEALRLLAQKQHLDAIALIERALSET
jgi:hypothetical protein